MGADFEIKVEDAQILGAMRRMIALAKNPSPVMSDIATIGENSTRLRFRTETGPDGKQWKPSIRVQLHGGKTLTKEGHLSGSLSSNHGRDFAEWGVNRVYAAIHQFGGRAGRGLRTLLVPRPYLGVSDDDAGDILAAIQLRINGAAHAG